MRKFWCLAAVYSACFSTSTLAQDAGSLLRDRQDTPDVRLPDELTEPDAQSEFEQVPAAAEAGQTVFVQGVSFSGQSELLTDDQRQTLSVRISGQNVGFAEIRALADEANTMLRRNGYLLAQATIPPQDITTGILTLEIQNGVLEGTFFEFQDGVRVRESLLAAIASRYAGSGHISRRSLESALLRMNDLHGVTVRSRLAPGEAPGSSRLIIEAEEGPLLAGALFGDNFGSPSTGQAQGHAHLSFADLTGAAEYTRFGFSYSEGQRFVSANFSLPLGASGVGFIANYGYLDYENIDAIGQAAGLNGEAHYGSIGLLWQAVRSRQSNLRFDLSLNGKSLIDDSAVGRLADKRSWSGTLGATADGRDSFLGGGVSQVSLSWTYGDLDLSRAPASEFADFLGLRTQGEFHRVNLDAVRIQSLPQNFSMSLRASAQWANKNLDSSETFSLGGPYGVRGWPVGEGRGDMGMLTSAELRYDVPGFNLGALRFATFIDAGRVRINKRTFGLPSFNACSCNSYSLSSAGLGLNWQHERFSLTASWAHGLGSNPGRSSIDDTNVDGESDRQQFWISGSIRF